ncbi:integrase [Pseudomonas frederiksbergensis]|uniref:Integrase n=1 Tax=Pseudomonas frederiksbergensis TaxID=104087 RepID=A0A423KGB4_9PSED|nr:integrase [Pseudomonas frederiksbergensis]RON51852.1 integrase [Pseudomonas frederiksbergensis]
MEIMEFRIGESVFSTTVSGVFTVIGYDVTLDSYIVQASDMLSPPFNTPRDNILKINSELTDRIRNETLAEVEQLAQEENEPKLVSRYTPEQILQAKAREIVIKPLHEAKKVTKAVKIQAMKRLEIGQSVLNDLLARYRRWPNWESLVPGISGRMKGATRFDQDIEDLIAIAAKEDHTGPGGTVQAVINGVRGRCLAQNKKPPSDATIRRRYNQISAREALAKDKGVKAARDKFDTFDHGSSTTHALELIHADNSPLDCHAIDPVTGKWLGRPNLTIIVDDHTSSYLGFALTFRYPSRNTLADAMFMAVNPKDALLAEFGLSSAFFWIQYGAAERYRVDGGGDLNAKTALAALAKHNIAPEPRLRPQSGGKVERGIGKINPLFMQRLRGAIASNRKMARGEDPQSMAVYSLTDLFILIITQICIWHECPGDDGKTPNQKWISSFGIHDGVVKIPRTLKDPLQFWIDILHEQHVRVRREGILTLELLYEVGPYKNRVGEPVRVKLDYNNLHRAWVEFEGRWVEIKLKNPDLIPKSMWEWNIQKKTGLPPGQLTIAGLLSLNEQRELMKGLITKGERRRLEEANELQSRVITSLSPPADQISKDITPSTDANSAPQQRGPTPPMMGDDDL